jgi:hypothetical protein
MVSYFYQKFFSSTLDEEPDDEKEAQVDENKWHEG